MAMSDVKELVAEKLGWTTDIFYLFYLTTDKDQLSYYIVKDHCIKAIAVIDDRLNRCVNIWK